MLSEKFMTTRGKGGRMEYNDFPSKICCLTGPKIFVSEFCVPETCGYLKSFWEQGGRGEGPRGEGWSITSSRRKFVVSNYRKTS